MSAKSVSFQLGRRVAALARICLALSLTIASWLGVLVCRVRFPPASARRWPAIRRIYRAWARGLLRVLAVKPEVRGVCPQPPFLLVSNHLSYVDIFLLAAHVDTTFIAKADIAAWPVFGAICRAVDTLFVDREARRDVLRVGAGMIQALERGRGLVLFAEGTTSEGSTILPLRTPLLAAAARWSSPVHFATISYCTHEGDRPAREAVCWWGDAGLLPHLWQLAQLRQIYATVSFGPGPVQDDDRKRLAARLRESMLASFTPVSAPEDECRQPDS